jgi:stage II sporulation protein D
MRRIPAIPPVALVLLAVLGLSPSPLVAQPAPAPGDGGWAVERVRFESLDEGSSLGLLDGNDYRGTLELTALPGTAKVVAINGVGLEDYVRGVSEVPVGWPLEAQKAQAIAARTFALHQTGIDVGTSWREAGADICATQACQVYAGLAKERRPGAETWAAAVDATRGQVLLHAGAPILAKYSSSNGGSTIPGGRAYLPGVDDPDDAHSPLHRWQSRVGLTEVAAIYGIGGTLRWVRSVGTIVEFTEELPGGEVTQHHVAAPDFRTRLNSALPAPEGLPRRVPSNRFATWTDVPTGTVFVEGRGYGHGIGMSQYGALGKALRGLSAEEILAAYYGGLRPAALAEGEIPETVRVAVADAPSLGVTSAGRFRVVDESGRVLAHVAEGDWHVRSAGGGRVEVVPPQGQDTAPVISPIEVDSPVTTGEEAAVVRFGLSAPALLDISVARPASSDLVFDPHPASAGELTYRLPAERRGQYVMTVNARAGDGRESSLPIRFRVGELPVRGVPDLARFAVPSPPTSITLMVGLAGMAWLAVVGALAALSRRA